jgi:hypothetical protein
MFFSEAKVLAQSSESRNREEVTIIFSVSWKTKCRFRKLNRVHAHHFAGNAVSGRVMRKRGMQYEGVMRQAVVRFDRYAGLECHAILREDYTAARADELEGNET